VATFGRRFIRKCVVPMRIFSVPNGCSTVSRRARAGACRGSRRCLRHRIPAVGPKIPCTKAVKTARAGPLSGYSGVLTPSPPAEKARLQVRAWHPRPRMPK
jgi:hypothetical protein